MQRQVASTVRRGAGRKGSNDLARGLPYQNQGYHFEHNFGHGYQHLSVVFAVLMMLAFLVDQVQQLCCPLFQAVWVKLGSKRRLWERMRALCYDYALESMQHLCEALFYGLKKTAPVLALDSSSLLLIFPGDDTRSSEATPGRGREPALSSRQVAAFSRGSEQLSLKKRSRKPGIGNRQVIGLSC